MAVTSQDKGEDPSDPEGMSLTRLLRPLSERRESVRPFVPWIGGPRLYLLLLYAAVVIGAGIEFFMSWETWYGNWEVYNSYLFVVTGAFLLFGAYLLFDITSAVEKKTGLAGLPLPRSIMGQVGLLVTVASVIGLALIAPSEGGWAVLLSVVAVAGFIALVTSSKVVDRSDTLLVAIFGIGLILAMLVPIHEAYDVARTTDGEYLFSGLNMSLLIVGAVVSILALQMMRTRDGHFAAWLIGSMAIFLVAFHEQVGIMPSDMLGQYDRALAGVGIIFSFVPLAMYIWRELQYSSIWTRLRRANSFIRKGDFNSALKEAETALNMSFDAGVARRFALPWSMKGDALYGLKEHTKAKAQYDISLEMDPEDDMTWCQMGNIQAFDAKRAVALNSYERALKINPNNAYAWNNKGVIYVSLAWPEEAMVCFNKAMLLMPKNFDTHINLAKITSRLERHDESVMHYQHALELRPDSEVAQFGLRREFLRGQRIDQIHGWEQLGLDTRYLWRMLKEDPADFEKHTKELLSSIVEQRTQLTIGTGRDKIDVNAAIETILRVTESSGATMEQIERRTGLMRDQLVLPMALLMKTERLHFTRFGEKDIYVSKGKAPEEPVTPPAAKKKELATVEISAEPDAENATEAEDDEVADDEPPARRRRFVRDKGDDEDIVPTASVLVFGKRKPKEAPKPPKKKSKKTKKKS